MFGKLRCANGWVVLKELGVTIVTGSGPSGLPLIWTHRSSELRVTSTVMFSTDMCRSVLVLLHTVAVA